MTFVDVLLSVQCCREHFCHRLKWSLNALLYMSFESHTPNFSNRLRFCLPTFGLN